MGVPPFLLASSVKAVIAQRLVKKLNPATRIKQELDPQLKQALGLTTSATSVFQADENLPINQAYSGRLGVYEIITLDQQLKAMIHQNKSEDEMSEVAHQTHPSIETDAREKLLAGLTSVDEILRVIHSG